MEFGYKAIDELGRIIMNIIDIIILGMYLVGMIVMGFFANSKVDDMDDFILGGRSLNGITLTGTIVATLVGSGMTMGAVGEAYKRGATGNVLFMYLGLALGLFAFSFLSKKVRETGKRTMAEIIEAKFGRTSRLISAVIIIGYAISIVAINIAGIRTIIISIFGESLKISAPMLTVIVTIFAIFYTSTGGFYAVALMDTIQLGIIVMGIMVLGPIIGLVKAGGLKVIADIYTSMGSSITNPFANGLSSGAIGFLLAYLLSVPGDPSIPQRALSGKDDKTTKRAFNTAGFMSLAFGVLIILIGTSAYVLAPDLENPEFALVHFIINNYPVVLKGLTLIGVLGAVISSFDSFLVLATTHIIYDLGSVFNIKSDEKTTKKIMSLSTVILGIIALIIALYIQSLFTYLYMVLSVVGAALVPVFIAALYFQEKTTSTAANASMIVGTVVTGVLYLIFGYNVPLGDPVFLGIISSTLTLIVVSVFTNKKQAA